MLTRARLRDKIVERTGYRQDVVAHILDVMEELMRAELVAQGEIMLRGLFRVTTVQRGYRPRKGSAGPAPRRIVLLIKPTRILRRKLNQVPTSR